MNDAGNRAQFRFRADGTANNNRWGYRCLVTGTIPTLGLPLSCHADRCLRCVCPGVKMRPSGRPKKDRKQPMRFEEVGHSSVVN